MADYFNKWCEAYLVWTIDVPEIAKVFVENWISYYGVPLKLHTNQVKLWVEPVFRDLQAVKDQPDQNCSTPPRIRWNGGAFQQGTLNNIFLKLSMSIKKPWTTIFRYLCWHTDLQFMRALAIRQPRWYFQVGIWLWIETVMWFGIWNTIWEANTYQWICHGNVKSSKENLRTCDIRITSCIRLDEDSLWCSH